MSQCLCIHIHIHMGCRLILDVRAVAQLGSWGTIAQPPVCAGWDTTNCLTTSGQVCVNMCMCVCLSLSLLSRLCVLGGTRPTASPPAARYVYMYMCVCVCLSLAPARVCVHTQQQTAARQ